MAGTILDYIMEASNTQILAGLVVDAGLAEVLNDPTGDLTLFAPTDDAFALVNPGTLDFLRDPANVETLREVLTYHVTAPQVCVEAICPNRITGGIIDYQKVQSVQGSMIDVVAITGDQLADFLPPDLPELPGLLFPDGLFPLIGINGFGLPFTLLGLPTVVNGATVNTADVVVDGGIIQVISRVLTTDQIPLPADTLGALERYTDFNKLLDAAGSGVRDTLSNPDVPVTVVAPSNNAYDRAPSGQFPYVLADAARAADAANYNIAPGVNTIAELLASAPTDLGGMSVTAVGNTLFIDGAEVVREVASTNGIVLQVTAPVYPSDMTLPTSNVLDVARDAGFGLFADLCDDAGLTRVLNEDGPYTVFAVADEVLTQAVIDNPFLLDVDGMPTEVLKQILQNHVVVDPPAALLEFGDTYYKDAANGVSCEGIALELGPIAITIADFCQPREVDTLQGGQMATVSESKALIPCILETDNCADLSAVPDSVNPEFFIGCIQNCDDDIATCLSPGGDCASTVLAPLGFPQLSLCIISAVAGPAPVSGLVSCLKDLTLLDPDWIVILDSIESCTSDDDKCGGKELFVDPTEAAWLGLDPTFVSDDGDRRLAEEELVGFGSEFNLPAANGVVHQVEGILEYTTFNIPEEDPPAKEINDFIWAMSGLTVAVGAMAGAMFVYKRKYRQQPTDGLYGNDETTETPLL